MFKEKLFQLFQLNNGEQIFMLWNVVTWLQLNWPNQNPLTYDSFDCWIYKDVKFVDNSKSQSMNITFSVKTSYLFAGF
jgi:hypothetical protein